MKGDEESGGQGGRWHCRPSRLPWRPPLLGQVGRHHPLLGQLDQLDHLGLSLLSFSGPKLACVPMECPADPLNPNVRTMMVMMPLVMMMMMIHVQGVFSLVTPLKVPSTKKLI